MALDDTRGNERAVGAEEIFLVDDDPSMRASLSTLFSEAGYCVTSFADRASFVASAGGRTPAAVILDPGRSGLDVLRAIDAPRYAAPIFVVSAWGDIPMAVEAVKLGASDFFEKQDGGEAMLGRVRDAISARAKRRSSGNGDGAEPLSFPGRELLTPRERTVVELLASAASNQETADRLGISRRTVEAHRARIAEKLKAKNAADLMRIVFNHKRAYS